jgi:hypothetical protein
MKKWYNVKENNKIENGKKRLVEEPVEEPVEVTGEEYDHDVQEVELQDVPKELYRPAEPKDIIYDKEIQVRSPFGDSNDVRVSSVLSPQSSSRAFVADDGHTYGLELSFVKVSG